MRFLYAILLTAPLACGQAAMNMPGMDMTNMPGMKMSSSDAMGAASMDASGTSRNPASSPMEMLSTSARGWNFMAHGVVFLTDTQQTGPRGHDKFFSANWFMGEASHSLGRGTFRVKSMLSLEPATITNRRYPEPFQTGETAYGKALVDAQHPHDFLMELAVEYSRPLGTGTTLVIYAAPVGDPALGPVAFPHRVSAAELPQATLAHHLQDSTHVSNEVITMGLRHGRFGIEASGFHGGEPNENRWNIDHGAIDSWSSRITWAPNDNWSSQVSTGRLHHPEALETGDQIRTTASVTYNRPYTGGNWATSLIWGRIHRTNDQANRNGWAVESVARFAHANYVTGRVELVDKDELLVPGSYRIAAYTAGYTRDLALIPRIASGVGFNATTYGLPQALRTAYGNRPVAMMLFLRFRLKG